MTIPNPRPLGEFNKFEPETEVQARWIEPWIDAYKAHEDDPKRLLTMTFHHFAERYEKRTMTTEVDVGMDNARRLFMPPLGTLMFPVSDQARRIQDEDGNWGPYPEEKQT